MNLYQADLIIRTAMADYHPRCVFALFSGGHDSLAATHFAMCRGYAEAVVHLATGTGIPQTYQFVQETCHTHHWPLYVYRPPLDEATGMEGAQYRDFVLREGFPGPGGHRYPYVLLKERAIEQLIRDHKRHRTDRIMLINGARKQESRRRMAHAVNRRKQKARIGVAPLVDWSTDDRDDYLEQHGLQRNLVSDLLHISGECLCGAFARPGELNEIACWFPEVANRIKQLQVEAKCAGVHSRWGTRRPDYFKRKRHGQLELAFPLCSSCNGFEQFEQGDTHNREEPSAGTRTRLIPKQTQ